MKQEVLLGLLKGFYSKAMKEPKMIDLVKKDRELDVLVEKIKLLESLQE